MGLLGVADSVHPNTGTAGGPCQPHRAYTPETLGLIRP